MGLTKYSRTASFVICNLLLICCVALSIVILQNSDVHDRGIADIQLNVSAPFDKRQLQSTAMAHGAKSNRATEPQLTGRQLTYRDIDNPLTRLPGASEIKSKIQGAATTVRSAASALETQIHSEINKTLDKINLPVGVSLGTEKLCIEYRNSSKTCEKLPVSIAEFLPNEVVTLLKDEIDNIQDIQDKVTTNTLGTILLAIKLGIACTALAIVGLGLVSCYFHTLDLKARLFWALVFAALASLLDVVPFVMLLGIGKQVNGVSLPQILHLTAGNTYRLAFSILAMNLAACFFATYTVWKTPIPLLSVSGKQE